MTLVTLLAAVSIAFPPEGAQLPYLERCYVMGAADAGEEVLSAWCLVPSAGVTNRVAVGKTGAWATVIDVKSGTNVVEVGGVKRTFVVESLGSKESKKAYAKLEYAADTAKPHPEGKKPEEITVAAAIADGIADWVAGK